MLPTVLIPDGESQLALAVATCARRTGHRVAVLSTAASARIRFSRHCASFTAVRPHDAEERLESALAAIAEAGPCVVLPVSEAGVTWSTEHADALHRVATLVDLPDRESFAIASDKSRLPDFLARSAIPHPDTRVLASGADLTAAAHDLEFPLLWKPARSSGGRGIRRLVDSAALAGMVADGPGVLQSEIPGDDWGASVLCRDGHLLAVSVQQALCPARRPFTPATAIAFRHDDEVIDVVRRLAAALRWNGIMNVDLRRDGRDGRVRVLEINPRYWATLPGSCAAGVHFPHLACLAALGKPFAPPQAQPRRHVHVTAARTLVGRGAGFPTLAETTFWTLVSDPLPFVAGRVGQSVGRLITAMRALAPRGGRTHAAGDVPWRALARDSRFSTHDG